MRLWCSKCETHTEHKVMGSWAGPAYAKKIKRSADKMFLTERDGVMPLVVMATCECSRKDVFVCNSNSVTESSSG